MLHKEAIPSGQSLTYLLLQFELMLCCFGVLRKMLLRVTRDLKLVTEVRHIFLQSFNLICGRKSFPHRFVHIDVGIVSPKAPQHNGYSPAFSQYRLARGALSILTLEVLQ